MDILNCICFMTQRVLIDIIITYNLEISDIEIIVNLVLIIIKIDKNSI